MGKIVFAGNTAWGMYNFRGKLMKRFVDLGHNVTVIVPYDQYVHELVGLGVKVEIVNLKAKSLNPLFDLYLLFQYYRILARLRPDICLLYTIKPNIYASIASSFLNIPHIAIITGLGYVFLSDSMISKIVKKLYKFAFTKTNEIWFLNKDDMAVFREIGIVSENKVRVLPGEGLDMDKYSEKELQPFPTTVSFLLISRMLYDKGVGVFVEAAERMKKKYPDVTFKLLGMRGVKNPNAIPDEVMERWIVEKNVEYLGETKNVIPFINDCTCVVLPSYYREGVPFVLLEGSSLQRPIITTNGVGCKEVIRDGYNGFVCEQKNVDSLVSAMEKIIHTSIEDLAVMGRNGREFVRQNYSLDIVFEHYLKVVSKYL